MKHYGEDPWEITKDHPVNEEYFIPCPHCIEVPENDNRRRPRIGEHKVTHICPQVVIVYNEGGYAYTVVCLDCILEELHA